MMGTAKPKPKAGGRQREKDMAHAAEVAQIKAVREAVWVRSRGRCEMTGLESGRYEMHECWSRAMTRNMRPDLRFNTKWCLRLTREAHAQLTDNKMTVYFKDIVLGADGSVVFVPSDISIEEAQRADRVGEQRFGAPSPVTTWFTAQQVWELYRDTHSEAP